MPRILILYRYGYNLINLKHEKKRMKVYKNS